MIEARRAIAARPAVSGSGKGRGAPRARKVTSRTFRVAGCTVTIECRRGLDDATLAAALEAALARVRGGGEAAA